ncbi:DUF4129 domain-containing protein [Flavobacterium jejuense]|uniref:DUF4129 domain-containing protein n=1 Tax=Flavobacterium jejuense TaxID=1544455 RepID=A0ABX0IYE4_9FLAO|nr:DUF4129 domain-containing protein [Flavobacterium jejuense]NHN27583.1 DUF4129 domain-containing protein [Flavobacterium jejuense]
MNKFLYILVFLFTHFGFAQSDSITNEYELEQNMYSIEPSDSLYFEDSEGLSEVHPKHFNSNFKEKYNNNDFKYETVIDAKQLTAWDRFWKAVGDFFERLFDFSNVNAPLSGFEIFIKIIAFIIIGFVIYLIVRVIINKEGQWVFGKRKKKITVSEMVEENIHTIDFKDIIKKAKTDKEYRLSIRYYYLWLLKSLSDKEIIEWDIEKTNSDYLYEIQSISLKENFKYLSYIYDYSWYGEFEINEKDFSKAEAAFLKAIANK